MTNVLIDGNLLIAAIFVFMSLCWTAGYLLGAKSRKIQVTPEPLVKYRPIHMFDGSTGFPGLLNDKNGDNDSPA